MANYEQIERWMDRLLGLKSKSRKWEKKQKLRRERRRAKQDPECGSEYRKYKGHEY